MEAYVRGLVADGMWGPMENEMAGTSPKFLAGVSECLEGVTRHDNARQGGGSEKILACEVWGLLEQRSEDDLTDF